jgi:8-oxo-dGTP pyrophosphatase MutT (NUDIX family)
MTQTSAMKTLYEIADELRAIADYGLMYVNNEYDRDRYEKVQGLSARLLGMLESKPEQELLQLFQDLKKKKIIPEYQGNLSHISPWNGANAVVVQDNKILLGKRTDNGLWDTFGGLVEVGETLAEAAVREAKEEAGIAVKAIKLMAVFDSRLWGTVPVAQLYHVHFLCGWVGGQPVPSNEVTEVAWFSERDAIDLQDGLKHWLPILFKVHRGEIEPYFDDVTKPSEFIPLKRE